MCFYINWKYTWNGNSFIYTALCFKLYGISKHFLQDPNFFMFCSSFKILIGRGKASHRDVSGDNVNLWDLGEL